MKKRVCVIVLLLVMAVLWICACGLREDGAEGTENGGEEKSDIWSEESEMRMEMTERNEEVVVLKDAIERKMGAFIGTGITASEIKDEKLWEIITTHFNAVTIGNELKPDCMFGYSNGICPGTREEEMNGEIITVPQLNYSRAEEMLDKILNWNLENPDSQIKVRGHVLVWHSQTPEWFFHEDYDKEKPYVDIETMNVRLEWYIKAVLTHFTGEESKYRDLFYGWDVVNEAVSDNSGSYRTDKENPGEPLSNDTHGNNSSWYHIYESNEYIINAFIYANKYAPASLELYYNDYNECYGNKIGGIAELLRAVKEQEGEAGTGTRIDGMGMQGHYDSSSPGMDKLDAAIRIYAGIVGKIQITELDLKASAEYDGTKETRQGEYERQAVRYQSIYRTLYLQNSKDTVVTGITFWGVADHYSWLQSRSDVGGGSDGALAQCPLLFDENYQPKPCFWVFVEGE